MKVVKAILPVSVAVLFLTLAFTPSVGADDPVNSNPDLVIEIGYKDNEGYQFFKELVVSEEQLQAFNTKWTEWETLVEDIRIDEIMDPIELLTFEAKVVELVNEIKEMTYIEETDEYAFPELGITGFIRDSITLKGLGRKIFSIGRARAWLPFNRQGESFIGIRFMPIILQHTIGFSKVRIINLFPPSYGIEDRLFMHNVFTMGFVGLYINFGERYLDRPAGPVLLIGSTLCLRLGEDIP